MGFLKRKRDLSEITVSNLKSDQKEERIAELVAERDASLYQLEEILVDIAEESGNRRLVRKRQSKKRKNI